MTTGCGFGLLGALKARLTICATRAAAMAACAAAAAMPRPIVHRWE
jgi:hypothetical protein